MADRNLVRIPNLPIGKIVEEDGRPTDDELTYRQALTTNLQKLFGNEGVVVPTQTSADITKIQNNTNIYGQYTCQFGTELYQPNTTVDPDSDPPNDKFLVAMDDGTTNRAPVFKQAVLVDGEDGSAGSITNYIIVNIGGTKYKMALYALA